MNAEDPTPAEEQCAALLAACDEALARGGPPVDPEPDLPVALQARLQRARHCLQRLDRVWPRGPSGVLEPTTEPIPCPLCGHTFEPLRAGPPAAGQGGGGSGECGDSLAGVGPLPGYEILQELGRGGMGVVYKARQIGLKRLVAVKMILAGTHAGCGQLARFRAEAEAAAQLQHPNIVPIHEVGEHNGQPYYSMEFVAGGNLAHKLAGAPQRPQHAAQLVETLARAAHYAHQHGVVHRDLKPANILLVFGGPSGANADVTPAPDAPLNEWTPKITDFGMAKLLTAAGQTQTGTILGTPEYMAPEQAAGRSKDSGPATDIYALGTILYVLLTGRPPFQGESPLETLHHLQTEEPVPPRRLQPRVPRDLQTIVLRCLQKETRRRYPTAQALAEDLHRFSAGAPILARPLTAVVRLGRWCGRNRLLATLGTFIVLLLGVIAAGSFASAWSLREERDLEISQRQAAQRARQQATDNLREAYLAQAQAGRFSERAGRRFSGLEALARAAVLRPSLELRNEAIACLALADLRRVQTWECGEPLDLLSFPLTFDAALQRYVWNDRGTLRICRLSDNQELLRLPGRGDPAWIVQFSPDGRFLAARHHPVNGDSQHIVFWNLSDAATIRQGSARLPGRFWDFSADSRRLAASQANGTVLIYDLPSGKEIQRLSKCPSPTRLAFHPDGRKLAMAFWQPDVVQVRALDTGKVILELPHPQPVRGMAWQAGGAVLATACADGRVYLWDAATGKRRAVLEGHEAPVVEVAFSHAGDLLASWGWDGTVRLWDTAHGMQLVSTRGGGRPVFSPDDRRLGFFEGIRRVGIWEVAAGLECRTLHGHQPGRGCCCVDFSPDGRLLASADSDGVRLWDAATARPAGALPAGDSLTVRFHPDGKSLFTSGPAGLKRWSLEPAPAGGSSGWRVGPPQHLGLGIARMDVSRNGQAVAIITAPGQAVVLRGDQLAEKVWLRDCPEINAVGLSPDGKWVAAGTWLGARLRVWNAETGVAVPRAWPAQDAYVAFSPDGRWLAAGTGRAYYSWEVGTWKPGLRLPRALLGNVSPLAFAADGKVLALALSDREVTLIDPSTGRQLATLAAPHPQRLTWLCFSPDGSRLAAACANQTIQLWDLRRIRQQLAAMKLDWEP